MSLYRSVHRYLNYGTFNLKTVFCGSASRIFIPPVRFPYLTVISGCFSASIFAKLVQATSSRPIFRDRFFRLWIIRLCWQEPSLPMTTSSLSVCPSPALHPSTHPFPSLPASLLRAGCCVTGALTQASSLVALPPRQRERSRCK